MKKSVDLVITCLLLVVFIYGCAPKEAKNYLYETQEDFDSRMEWWRDAGFGMFIHWGLYAVPGGVYKGTIGHAEWIQATAAIPVDEYEKYTTQFNPVKFDADEWV
ncbi:unnamed protein product, partial [marine sediment metagenome]